MSRSNSEDERKREDRIERKESEEGLAHATLEDLVVEEDVVVTEGNDVAGPLMRLDVAVGEALQTKRF